VYYISKRLIFADTKIFSFSLLITDADTNIFKLLEPQLKEIAMHIKSLHQKMTLHCMG